MPLFDRGLQLEGVFLNKEEAEAIFEWLEAATGCSPNNVFKWNGKDDIENPNTSAAYKIFKACGRDVPDNLDVVKEKE